MKRRELVELLDSWLEPGKLKDHTYNGLQFEGCDEVAHTACAVDVSYDVLNKAAEIGADFLITHHGLIWGGLSKITGFDKDRIDILCKNNINLYCSHLPLDLHPEYGNNAILIEELGGVSTGEIFFDVGYYADISTTYTELKNTLKEKVSDKIVEMNFGGEDIDKIAVCTGGAALDLRALFEAADKGVNTIVSGETNSLYYHYAKELKMNILCAGHYATEVFGVNKINKEIKKLHPQIKTSFIDFPTGF